MGDDFLDAWDMKTNSTPDERRTRLNTWRKGRTRGVLSSRHQFNQMYSYTRL